MSLTDLFRKTSSSNNIYATKTSTDSLLLLLTRQVFKETQEKLGGKMGLLQEPNAQSNKQQLLSYVSNLYDLLLQTLGPEIARNSFEREINIIKTTYGPNEEYFQLLKELPIPVMTDEKLLLLNRQELEEELRSRIQELENIKLGLEKTVAQRTQVITAERNKLSVVLAGITDAVIAVDLYRHIITFNKAAAQLTGFSVEEATGKPINEIIKVFDGSDELSGQVFCPIQSDQFEGVVFTKNNLKLVGRNGQSFVNLTAAKIKEGVHVGLGCILTLHDVSGEQELEKMKLDFVSMSAHELRTPLTAIKGYLAVLLHEGIDNLTDDQKKFVKRVNVSTHQLVSLVENLLSVTRIEEGVFTVTLESLDWVEVVKQTVDEFKIRADENKIELSFIPPTNPIPKVLVDPVRITEVLNNLLSNAITYTQASGRVTVWLEDNPQGVITHIQDSGQGIPKQALPHLFTKFFRITGILEQGSKGTGLGLYISKIIVEMHHGKIWVVSELGKGSTFSFILPKVT